MTRTLIVVATIAELLIAASARAQLIRFPKPRLISIGDRVQVGIREDTSHAPLTLAAQHIRGVVRAIAPDTLYLDLAGPIGTLAVPRAAIRGVEVSTGTPSRAASAAEFGEAGALLGGLFLPSFIPHAQQRFGSAGRAVAASIGIGVGVSAIIGALMPYEHWRLAWIPE